MLRRDKALFGVAEYRDNLARRLRESADRIIAANNVFQLEDASSKLSSRLRLSLMRQSRKLLLYQRSGRSCRLIEFAHSMPARA
jgi:hypothetical protein